MVAVICRPAFTLAQPLWLIIAGVGVFTFGFFAAHAPPAGWVGRRAGERRALASALYLSSYYLGASVLGSLAGTAWPIGDGRRGRAGGAVRAVHRSLRAVAAATAGARGRCD